MKVYINKNNTWEYKTIPAPTDVENYYVVEMEETEVEAIPMNNTYNPTSGKFEFNTEKYNSQVEGKRKVAYEAEADPLYKEWQYELMVNPDTAEEYKTAWINKVNEIKERFPKM